MAINVGSVEVSVVPNARGWDEKLAAQLNPGAKKAGEQAGEQFSKGVQDRVGKTKVDMPSADTKKAEAAQEKFLRDFNARMKKEYDKTGQDSGNALANGLRLSFLRNSPVIAGAVAGGLIAGAPLAIAGAGVLFAGIAAVAEKSNAELKAAASEAGDSIKSTFTQAAQVTVPMFTTALGRVADSVHELQPQLQSAFSALGGPIDSLTTGVISLVRNAMPGLVAAVRNAGPVFQGLASFLGQIGTGLGQFFQLVSQHGTAAGQVFSSLGQILGAALPILGHLIDVGVQLGATVLPPVASALSLVAKALDLIAPVLPIVVAGLGGLMIARSLQGPLSSLAQNLAFASYNGSKFADAAGKLSTATSTLSNGLPLVGTAIGLLTVAFQAGQQDADKFRQSAQDLFSQLDQGGVAADHAQAKLDLMRKAAEHPPIANGWFSDSLSDSLNKAQAAAAQAQQEMTPLSRAQQDVTKATNDYLDAVDKYGPSSGQAAGAAVALSDAQNHLATVQGQVNQAAQIGADVAANLKGQLQTTADAASAANTQISLLKGSLDALTGKTVTMTEAQIAVSESTRAAVQAVKDQTGALVINGDVMGTHTARSDAAQQALIQLSRSSNQLISTMEQQGATTDQVSQKDAQLRQNFIDTATQMGYTKDQAKYLADQIYGIPGERHVQINTNAADANAAIQTVQQQIDNLHGRNVTIQILSASSAGPAAYAVPGSGTGGYAFGGVVPGYAPGVDRVPAMLSPGEGVLVPEAVRGIGGAAGIQALNAAFSSRVPRFANGGVVGDVLNRVFVDPAPFNSGIQGAANRLRDTLTSFSGTGAGSPFIRILGQAIAASMGFGGQFGAIDYIFSHESGWNPLAQNPTSSAFGIPQFLSSTWAAYGGRTTDPATQIRDGIRYMVDRYGSPNAAAAFWQGHHWYHGGGVVQGPPGANVPAVLQAGETVRTPAQEAALTQPITVIAQFGNETIEATAVRVVSGALDLVSNRGAYNP